MFLNLDFSLWSSEGLLQIWEEQSSIIAAPEAILCYRFVAASWRDEGGSKSIGVVLSTCSCITEIIYRYKDDINVICELLAVQRGDLELDMFSNSDAFIEFFCTT